jgi:serine/threonine-protein kinase
MAAAAPGRTRHRPLILLSSAATLLVVLGTAVAVQQSRRPDDQTPAAATKRTETTTAAASTPPPTTQPPTPTPTQPADPDTAALRRLKALRAADRPRAHPDGRYVVQLASKYPGIPTPDDRSPDGDHIYSAAEILREHQQLRMRFGADTLLLLSTDYGRHQKVRGHALWVTFVDPGLDSLAAGTEWCAEQFSGLSPQARDDACQARQLNPG